MSNRAVKLISHKGNNMNTFSLPCIVIINQYLLPNGTQAMYGLKEMEERKRAEWRGKENKKVEENNKIKFHKRIIKLNFIIWFDIKFDRKKNYNFFFA